MSVPIRHRGSDSALLRRKGFPNHVEISHTITVVGYHGKGHAMPVHRNGPPERNTFPRSSRMPVRDVERTRLSLVCNTLPSGEAPRTFGPRNGHAARAHSLSQHPLLPSFGFNKPPQL